MGSQCLVRFCRRVPVFSEILPSAAIGGEVLCACQAVVIKCRVSGEVVVNLI